MSKINLLVHFSNSFVIYLFQLINCTCQEEQIQAISKLKSKQPIFEYYIVVLSLKIMKLFKSIFVDLINKEQVFEMQFRDMGLNIGKIKKYSQELDSEIEQKINGGGGVMGRLKKITQKGFNTQTGIIC